MPQLDFFTYYDQFFNFLIGFVIFYLFFVKIGFPLFSSILKFYGKKFILVRKDILGLIMLKSQLLSNLDLVASKFLVTVNFTMDLVYNTMSIKKSLK